jgi:NitT/TauT family transport system ATP-binding protein
VISQFYTDGRGPNAERGSRIVADYKLSDTAQSTKVKDTQAFRDLVESIRRDSFDPERRKHVTQFNLSHPDSFQTLTEIEKRI